MLPGVKRDRVHKVKMSLSTRDAVQKRSITTIVSHYKTATIYFFNLLLDKHSAGILFYEYSLQYLLIVVVVEKLDISLLTICYQMIMIHCYICYAT